MADSAGGGSGSSEVDEARARRARIRARQSSESGSDERNTHQCKRSRLDLEPPQTAPSSRFSSSNHHSTSESARQPEIEEEPVASTSRLPSPTSPTSPVPDELASRRSSSSHSTNSRNSSTPDKSKPKRSRSEISQPRQVPGKYGRITGLQARSDAMQETSHLLRNADALEVHRDELNNAMDCALNRRARPRDDAPGKWDEEELPPGEVGMSFWTSREKAAFFYSIARHSKLRPDLIQEDVHTKSHLEVLEYLDLLESVVPPLSSDEHERIPGARCVSRFWMRHERKIARKVEEQVLPVAYDHRSLDFKKFSHLETQRDPTKRYASLFRAFDPDVSDMFDLRSIGKILKKSERAPTMAIDAKVLRELYDELKPFLWHVISDTVALRAVGTLPGLEGNEITLATPYILSVLKKIRHTPTPHDKVTHPYSASFRKQIAAHADRTLDQHERDEVAMADHWAAVTNGWGDWGPLETPSEPIEAASEPAPCDASVPLGSFDDIFPLGRTPDANILGAPLQTLYDHPATSPFELDRRSTRKKELERRQERTTNRMDRMRDFAFEKVLRKRHSIAGRDWRPDSDAEEQEQTDAEEDLAGEPPLHDESELEGGSDTSGEDLTPLYFVRPNRLGIPRHRAGPRSFQTPKFVESADEADAAV